MINEIWKDIIGFEGLYMISNHGNVKSLSRKLSVKGDFFRLKKETILTPSCDKEGYLSIMLSKDKNQKRLKVHRL